MAESKEKKPGALGWLGDFLTAKEVVTSLFSIGGGSTVVLWVSRKMFPLTWEPQDKLFASVAVFCFGVLASWSALAVGRKIKPSAELWLREKYGSPPELTLSLYGGTVAVVEIHNSGGKAMAVHAKAQIVSVSGRPINRQDPYFPMWRHDLSQQLVQFLRPELIANRRLKIALAGFQLRANPYGPDSLVVYGVDFQADRYTYDSASQSSPEVGIRLLITTTPSSGGIDKTFVVKAERQHHVLAIKEAANG